MFVINKEATQQLFINLSDEVSFDNYLFVVSGDGLENEKMFFAAETSEHHSRYHKFTIEENATEDLMNGIVSFPVASDLIVSLYNLEEKEFTIPEGSEVVWRGLFRVKREDFQDSTNEPTIETISHDPRR